MCRCTRVCLRLLNHTKYIFSFLFQSCGTNSSSVSAGMPTQEKSPLWQQDKQIHVSVSLQNSQSAVGKQQGHLHLITKKWNGHLWPITRTVDSGKNWSVRSMKLNPCVSCLQGLHTNITDIWNPLWCMTNKYNLCPFDLKLLWHNMLSPLKLNHFQDFCEPYDSTSSFGPE